MSDELFEKDELEDDDVEAHKAGARMRSGSRMGNDEGEGTEDVEAHRARARVRLESDEGGEGAEDVEAHRTVRSANDDDSDDVEAHLKRA